MLILVSGGSASGKSEFAESLVLQSGCDRRYYLATMIPYDEECRRRILDYQRAGVEQPICFEVPGPDSAMDQLRALRALLNN